MTTLKRPVLTAACAGLLLAMTTGLRAQQGEVQPSTQSGLAGQASQTPLQRFEEQKTRLIEKYDVNRNGKIDVEERKGYVTELARLRRQQMRQEAAARFKAADKNGDGRLDKGEIEEYQRQMNSGVGAQKGKRH